MRIPGFNCQIRPQRQSEPLSAHIEPLQTSGVIPGIMETQSLKMSEAPLARWVQITGSLFPDDAQITHPPAGASVWLRIRWKIRNDPKRPNKLARGINIYFTREFCKAYESLNQAGQDEWDVKVRDILAERYATFNPDHNVQHGAPMPSESWFITPGSIR